MIPIVDTGKLSDMGFYLCELNPAIRAALDFTTFCAQHYYESSESMFSPNSRKGRFIRPKKAYESRESALTMGIKTTQCMMECPNFNTAMMQTIDFIFYANNGWLRRGQVRKLLRFRCDPTGIALKKSIVWIIAQGPERLLQSPLQCARPLHLLGSLPFAAPLHHGNQDAGGAHGDPDRTSLDDESAQAGRVRAARMARPHLHVAARVLEQLPLLQ